MSIEKLTTANFSDKVGNSDKPVIIDFYADWCGPCKMIAPILDEIAEEYSDKVDVYKINVDENPELASKYSVMSIPNVISFKNGNIYKRVLGAVPKDDLLDLIN